MILGFHPWVYVQLSLRELGRWDPDAASRAVLERLDSLAGEVAEAGFEALEGMASLLETAADEERHAAALSRAGLGFLGVSHNAPLWDPAQRGATVDRLAAVSERVARLGGGHLGLSSVPAPAGRAKTADDYDAQAETLQAIAAAVRPFGVRPNLHTYAADAADDYREIRETLARVPAEDLALGADLAWLAWGGGDPLEVIARFGGRLTFCHLRNRRAAQEWAEGAHEGIDDQAALGAALRRAGFDGAAVFEPAFPEDAPTRPLAETWAASAAHLKRSLGLAP